MRRAARRAVRVAAGACVCLCAAWIVAGACRWVDVLAISTAHWVAVALVAAAAGALVRDRWSVGLALVAVVVGAVGVVPGRAWTLDARDPGAATLRVLVFNSHAINRDHDAQLALIERVDADVVVLMETEVGLSRRIRWDGELDGDYPARAYRGWIKDVMSPIVVLTRLPVVETIGDGASHEVGVRLEWDGGEVVVLAGHPRSPRTAGRWRQGNDEARTQAALIESVIGSGTPVIFAADLNSTPAGHRGRIIAGAGVRPAKPLWRPAGTFPARPAWPAQLAIDDAWVSPDLRVVLWRTVGPAGSDHLGVVVEVQRAR